MSRTQKHPLYYDLIKIHMKKWLANKRSETQVSQKRRTASVAYLVPCCEKTNNGYSLRWLRYSHKDCKEYKWQHISIQKILFCILMYFKQPFSFNVFFTTIFQFSASHDPSKIILICWFAPQGVCKMFYGTTSNFSFNMMSTRHEIWNITIQ